MADESTHASLRFIRKIAADGEIRRLTDSQLLQRYATEGDEAAFEILVHRHGAMVWRVCRDVLREPHAADDAFQATFLVLIRKAASIARPQLLGNWLYGVAHRVALRARKTSARRQARELHPANRVALATALDPADKDGQPLLQEELQRLPAKYRAPMILCYLEGRTNEEAARQLEWPVGTVKVRLMRGREMLRARLTRRGLALSAPAMAAALASNTASAVPAPLVDTTIKAAFLFVAGKPILSSQAALLAEGVLKTMKWTNVKIVALVLLALAFLGAGLMTIRALAADPKVVRARAPALGLPVQVAGPKEQTKMKTDVEKLQGTWNIVTLEVDGAKMEANLFKGAKIVMKGDAFTTFSMGAEYKGTFKIDATKKPKQIDLMFTEGPEKGNTSLGIYELDGDIMKICLTIAKKDRPTEFATKPGSGLALETLKRETQTDTQDALNHEMVRLGGEWSMMSGEIAGQTMPAEFVKTAKRMVKGNETTVTIGGQLFFKATFTIDISKQPHTVDYTMTDGLTKGKTQYGIYEWNKGTVRYCFAAPGKDRPTDFTTKAADERILSVWEKNKQ
jgi:RNA polymerase sigma factor (sigma-70 family)